MRAISLAKFEKGIVNEDAAIAKDNVIAVSDGAGGGGVFAEHWSQYLVEHVPEKPIKNYMSFDKWIDGIWEPFYNDCEEDYNKKTGELQHSFTRLSDFNNPPYLINCKDPLDKEGCRSGKFKIDKNCVVFAASDTLAHYILMMYEVSHKDDFTEEIQEAINAQTKNSNYINTALAMENIDFERDVIGKLQNCFTWPFLRNHIKGLKKKGLIGHDDYSLVFM